MAICPQEAYASPVPVRRPGGLGLQLRAACSPARLQASPITKESKFENHTTADHDNQALKENARNEGFRLCSSPAESLSFRAFQSRPLDLLDAPHVDRQLFPDICGLARQTRRRLVSLKQLENSIPKKIRLNDEEKVELHHHLLKDYSSCLTQEDALLILECSKM